MNSGGDDDFGQGVGSEPQCAECKYFYMTWDLSQRYGCRAFNFKSQQLPSQVVFSVDGRHCNSFQSPRADEQGEDAGKSSTDRKSNRINLKV